MTKREIRPGISRLFRLAGRSDAARDADDEINLHLKLRIDELIASGMSPDAARAEAERLFGEVEEERERFAASARRRDDRMQVREWMESVAQDVRYAFRTLRRDAGFTLFAVLIVGLGIGASATVFSLVNGVLLRPMPFRDPSRLIWISNISDDGVSEWSLESDHVADLAAQNRTLEGLAGYYAYYGAGNAPLTFPSGETERLTRVGVTCNFLPFLGVSPIIGRSFADDECHGTSPPVAMMTEALWRNNFGADPSIIGKTLTIRDQSVTIVGVVPASFDFPSVFAPGSHADLFAPFPLDSTTAHNGNTLAVIGRLKPGVSIAAAREDLVALGKQLTDEYPRTRNTLRPKVLWLDERINGAVRPALVILAWAVIAVMLIVCANLASLQHARMSARQREMAVRAALGAARGRLIRQALTESLVLAGGGAVLGVALTMLGTRLVSRLSSFDIPLLARVGVDARVLGIAALVAVITGMLVGLLPALSAPSDVHDSLKDGPRGSTRGGRHARVRGTLVVAEIAATCILLVSSGLLARSFLRLLDVQLGYKPEHAAMLRIDPGTRFADGPTALAYYSDLLGRARAIPGVSHAALGDILPFSGDRSWSVVGKGQVYARGQAPEGFVRVVSDGYFGTMGIELKEGRDFTPGDDAVSAPVVIVNESLARTLWPGRDPVNQEIARGNGNPVGWRVIGVVADVRHGTLEHAFTNEVYFPMRQFLDMGSVNLVVRTDLPISQLSVLTRTALGTMAPEAAKQHWRTLQELIDKVASPRRFVVILLGGFTVFSLVLAALGIYALVSYGVNQRTQEIGIRLALGAPVGAIRGQILRATLVLAGVGMAIGAAGAAMLVPSLRGMLFGISLADPASFAGALGILLVVAAAAGYIPALRASHVDPSVALRDG
ncbi:MAG TPA: ABC transporter permease [Gemmatimonadaceae bacterium]|nr:ABC transporter permease [Gemmatimonadaceae bacterium]